MPADLALRPDASGRKCDLVISPAGLVLDGTPVSAMLFGLLCDRRARDDDSLPASMPDDPAAPASLGARGGWAGDALDKRGELTGSRLWLLARAKMPEALASAPAMALEALKPGLTRRGYAVAVKATQAGPNRMRLAVNAGATTQAILVATS